ncbi:MAG: hypothetical protein JNL50_02665 [Phycisphaerae bacterium]|nr:hypothetical protein [Phycisphaerae bacterium]
MTTKLTKLTKLAKLAPTLAIFLASAAPAAIVSVSGSVQQIAPPALVIQGVSYTSSPDTATAWNELQGVPLSGIPADMVNHPGHSNIAVPGSLSGVFDSHYIHYRHTTLAPITGTIAFDGKIVGVMFTWYTLAASESFVEPNTGMYSTSNPNTGIDSPGEWFTTSTSSLTFHLYGSIFYHDTAEIRVITERVPAPGAAALAALAGAAALARRRR